MRQVIKDLPQRHQHHQLPRLHRPNHRRRHPLRLHLLALLHRHNRLLQLHLRILHQAHLLQRPFRLEECALLFIHHLLQFSRRRLQSRCRRHHHLQDVPSLRRLPRRRRCLRNRARRQSIQSRTFRRLLHLHRLVYHLLFTPLRLLRLPRPLNPLLLRLCRSFRRLHCLPHKPRHLQGRQRPPRPRRLLRLAHFLQVPLRRLGTGRWIAYNLLDFLPTQRRLL